jgi:MarR family transcriptional regulator for hemolysin
VKDTTSVQTRSQVIPKQLDRGRSVALKLSVVARQLRVSFDQSAEACDLTRAQWTLIGVVSRYPGATQRIVAEALEVREITAGRLIDRLCDEGYLRRDENPSDRRAYCVHLTPAAEPLLAKLDDLARIHEARIFSGFEAEALEKLDTLLDRIAQNLADLRARQTESQRAAAK